MEPGKCFADVISDPQALNEFLTSCQALSNEEESGLYISDGSSQLNLSQMEMVGSSHTNMLFSNSQMKQAQSVNSNMSNSLSHSPNSLNTMQSNLQNRQPSPHQNNPISVGNYGQSPLGNQGSFSVTKNQPLSINSTSATRTILPNTNLQASQLAYSYTNSNGQQNFVQKGNKDLKTNSIYTPKGSVKQAKSVPNILSKTSSSGNSNQVGQTIILPSNMNGQYILVNSSGQQAQPVALQQNLSQLSQQQQQQQQQRIQMQQQQDQHNPQLLVFPANIQQVVNSHGGTINQGSSNLTSSQNLSPSNQLKSVQQQQPKLAPLRVRQNVPQSKGISQANIIPKSQSLTSQSLSPLQSSQFLNQSNPTLSARSQLLPGQQAQGSGLTSTPQSYRSQTYTQGKAGDELKIIRPVAQPRGIMAKPVTGTTSLTTGSTINTTLPQSGTSHASKLSHFPLPQNQIQNLQSMVMQQGNESIRQAPQFTSANASINQISLTASSISQSLANSASAGGNQTGRADATHNIALQQLLRLSQAASQSSGGVTLQGTFSSQQLQQSNVQAPNTVISNSPSDHQNAISLNANLNVPMNSSITHANTDITVQNLSPDNLLNIRGDKGVKQQQLLKQLFSQQQQQKQQQQQLQQLQQQSQQQQQQNQQQQQQNQQQQIQQLQQQQLQQLQQQNQQQQQQNQQQQQQNQQQQIQQLQQQQLQQLQQQNQQQQQQNQQQQIQQLQQQQMQQLQQQQQQNVSSLPDVVRANIIEQNVQNILMRQNASKQGGPKQGALSPKLSTVATSANSVESSNPMQLFIPKQLPTSQLLELQQKLLAGKIMQKMQAVQPKPSPSSASGTKVNVTSMVSIPANSNVQTVTLRQVPLATSQQNSNQFIMPVVTQGMQFFLQTNVTKQATADSASPQQILVASGNNGTQRINVPIIGASSANSIASNLIKQVQATQQKSSPLQGVTIQHTTTPNIIVKPLDAAGVKVGLSEQQKTIQTKKLQQLLLQLTPSQRNLLVKKQQQYVSKGQSVPLMKLIMEVKQDNISVKQEVKSMKRSVTEEAKVEETSESKVSKRLKHCLQADQARVTDSNYKVGFNSLEDALSRLLPYHILNEEIPPDIEWQKAEALFGIVSKQLITRKEKLFDKYHALLLEESQREFSCSEMVMLERIFLADEKARFAKEKEDFKLGKLKIFQTSATESEVEDSAITSEKDLQSISLGENCETTNRDNDEIPAVVDTLDWHTTQMTNNDSIDNDCPEEEEEEEDEEVEDAVEECKTEENGEEDLESEIEYQEDVDMIECNDEDNEDNDDDEDDEDDEDNEDEELEERDDVEVDNEEDIDDLENEDYDDEDTNNEDYISSLGISDISSRYTNHDFDALDDLEDLARTTEHNMSEELSQATFNLMADLQNESSNDYYE